MIVIIRIHGGFMFKYKIKCDGKEKAVDAIHKMIINDFACGKDLFGGKLFNGGIHFKKCDETIKGFYLDESEDEMSRGAPIRVCFSGKFREENGDLFFDVFIYPRIQEILLLIFVCVQFTLFGKVTGILLSIMLLLFFGKSYYKMILDTYDTLKRII